jgi:hypothetical protein
MVKVLLCGDSFGVVDNNFPGLHFSEKFKDCEVMNLSQGGASNSMIQVQLHQGLQFNPTHVILLFTAQWRAEYNIYYLGKTNAELKHSVPGNKNNNWKFDDVRAFNENNYTTSAHIRANPDVKYAVDAYEQHMKYYYTDYESLKTYFLVLSMLDKLKNLAIPFCFSLGGFETDYNDCKDRLLAYNYLTDTLPEYANQQLKLNLWDHANQNNKPDKSVPKHHVIDDAVQTEFSRQCEEILYGTT